MAETQTFLPQRAETLPAKPADLPNIKLDMKGLTIRQRRFILCYAGNYQAAALAAGYTRKNIARAVQSLMANKKVNSCIRTIQHGLERYGIMNVLEAKMMISDLARHGQKESTRLAAGRLVMQWEGELDPVVKMKIESEHRETVSHTFTFQHLGPGALGRKLGLADDTVIDVEPRPVEPQPVELEDIL